MGYSPWGRKDSDTTERLHFTSCILVTSEILVMPSHPNLALPTQGLDEDSQRLGAGRCDVTWGYRGYLGAFWFQPPASLAQPPTSKGTCWWSSLEVSHEGGHLTKPTTSSSR